MINLRPPLRSNMASIASFTLGKHGDIVKCWRWGVDRERRHRLVLLPKQTASGKSTATDLRPSINNGNSMNFVSRL